MLKLTPELSFITLGATKVLNTPILIELFRSKAAKSDKYQNFFFHHSENHDFY